jgi:hypothetical protein
MVAAEAAAARRVKSLRLRFMSAPKVRIITYRQGGAAHRVIAGPRTEVVARGRVQLPTFALGVRCSMQLSYRATSR